MADPNPNLASAGAAAGAGAGTATAPAKADGGGSPAPAPTEKQDGKGKPGRFRALLAAVPTVVIVAIVVGIYFVNRTLKVPSKPAWLLTMLLLAALFVCLGMMISKRPLGI